MYSKTCVKQPPLKLTLVVDVERWLSYKGTCHVILLAKLYDMYLYKTDNFFHINHYLKSVLKVALLHRFHCTSNEYPQNILTIPNLFIKSGSRRLKSISRGRYYRDLLMIYSILRILSKIFNNQHSELFCLETMFLTFHIKTCFLGKIRKISICCKLILPREWSRLKRL